VNADGLLLGISFSIPLTFRLLSVAFGRAELRSRRRDCIAIPLSKPEHRAEALLNEWLCPEQRAALERHGYFEVRGCHTGKRYRIRRGRNMNIEELGKNGAQVAVWCFGPAGHLPLGEMLPRSSPLRPTSRPHSEWLTAFVSATEQCIPVTSVGTAAHAGCATSTCRTDEQPTPTQQATEITLQRRIENAPKDLEIFNALARKAGIDR
jgi:hypothetical protein